MEAKEERKTAVVTGAEGFIGSSLVHELAGQGWRVIALHHPLSDLTRLTGVPVDVKACDLLRPQDLEEVVPQAAEAFFHLAADVRITTRRSGAQMEVNLDGTKNAIDVALRKQIGRFLFTSSMAAYGIHDRRIDETTLSNADQTPIPYFRSKYLGELKIDEAIARGLDAVIVNPSNVLGPRDVQNMPAIYIRLVHAKRIPVIGPGTASFCDVREVARAMVSCIEHGRTGERYLLGGTDASFMEMGRIIESVVGGRAPFLVLPAPVFRAVGRCLDAYADWRGAHSFLTSEMSLVLSRSMLVESAKAIRDLDYRPQPLRQMIEDEAMWLREHGYLKEKIAWIW